MTLIGSRRDCDLFVGQDDVSKVHCALVNTGTAIIVTDLCSRSGTFVNGQRVSSATLHPGDELRIGSVPVEVRFLEPPGDLAAAIASEDDPNLALPTPLRLTGAEQQCELTTLPAVIGRRHACQVLLDTPDVSLAHALLFTIEGCPAIFDLGSRSGTYVNGERVTLAWLRDADRLYIGGEELSLVWQGPQSAACPATAIDAAGLADSAEAAANTGPLELSGFANLGSMIEGLKVQIGASQTRLAKRAALLSQREAELEARIAALEDERTRLATEERQLEQQAAELHAAVVSLERERAWFGDQRAQFERQRTQLDTRRAELERRLAEYEATVNALREREIALEERRAALAAAENEVASRQAELAEREVADVDATQRISRFRDALGMARRLFTSVEARSEQPAGSGAQPDASAQRALESNDEAPSAAGSPPDSADLPAPLVGEPLFAGLDPSSPEQWPPELQERLRLLCRESGKSDAIVISQVLAEYRAQRLGDRRSSGN